LSGSTDTPSRALDGDPTTRWSTGKQQTSGQFFQVDMGALHLIAQVKLDTSASKNDYPRGYALYLSKDGTSWGTPVATGSGAGPITQISFPWQGARFIKIVQTGTASNWWSIHELTVVGAGRSPLPRNGWIVSASLTCQSDVPSNVIDGQLSTRWSTGVVQADSDQWLQINMLAPQLFARIVMDSGKSSGDFAHQYQVFVSNDGASWSGPVASGIGSSQILTVDFPTQNAQYIRIYQTGSASNWWSIHELNVYTAFPFEPCAVAVPVDSTLAGSAKEIKYQQDILALCTGGGVPACYQTVVGRANADFFMSALGVFSGKMDTGVYQAFVRQRDSRLVALRQNPTDACDVAAHDDDGDLVSNSADQCPGTPSLTPVDAAGCPLTSIPAGYAPSMFKAVGEAIGIPVDPRCANAERPPIPNVIGVFRSAGPPNPNLGKAIWISRDPTTSTCPLFYEVEFSLTDNLGFRTTRFGVVEDGPLPWITAPPGAVQFHIQATDAHPRADWADYSVFTVAVRTRAFNMGGMRSDWSDYYTLTHADCVAGQPCVDR
jgi:hypothetical protein